MSSSTPALPVSNLLALGVELTQAFATPPAYGGRPSGAHEVIAERLLLQHVMEQILKDVSRTLWREYHRQKLDQQLTQDRLDEQRRLERNSARRRRETSEQMAAARTTARPEETTWIYANKSNRK